MIMSNYMTCVCGVGADHISSYYSERAASNPNGPRWYHLCEYERSLLSNGCGGKGGWMDPPDFCFEASCDHHDFNYWLGGDEAARKRADEQFLAAMLADAKLLSWPRRMVHTGLAHIYYNAVRMWGGRFFNYGTPRGWLDVEKVVIDSAHLHSSKEVSNV